MGDDNLGIGAVVSPGINGLRQTSSESIKILIAIVTSGDSVGSGRQRRDRKSCNAIDQLNCTDCEPSLVNVTVPVGSNGVWTPSRSR